MEKNRIAKGLSAALAALVAAMLALSLVPSAAWAAALAADSTGELVVKGLKAGDVASVWRVVETSYDPATNGITHAFPEGADYGFTLEEYLGFETDAEHKAAADKMAIAMHGQEPFASKQATGDKLTFEDLPMGQYLIMVTPGANAAKTIYQNTVASVEPVVLEGTDHYSLYGSALSVKSQKMTIVKTVDGGTSTDRFSLGAHVPFQVSVTVPAYASTATATEFRVTDQLSAGYDFDADSLTVTTADGTALPEGAYQVDISGDAGTFEVTFDYDEVAAFANQTIELGYTATLTDATDVMNFASNTASVTYNANPYDASSLVSDEVVVRETTYGLYVQKVDAADTAKGLSDATFAVYQADDEGTETLSVDGTDVHARLVTSITTDEEGFAATEHLGAGTFYLVETKAPTGYTLSAVPHEVTIDAASVDKSGEHAYYRNAGTISDTQLPTLPLTGGAGTAGLVGLGVVLMASGALFAFARGRQAAA